MSKDLTELHNQLATGFMNNSVRELIVSGGTFADLMLLIESVIVAGMMANVKVFNMAPDHASAMAEAAVNRAMERFSSQMNKELKR